MSLDESIDDENDENVKATPLNCLTEALLHADCNKVCCSDKKTLTNQRTVKLWHCLPIEIVSFYRLGMINTNG